MMKLDSQVPQCCAQFRHNFTCFLLIKDEYKKKLPFAVLCKQCAVCPTQLYQTNTSNQRQSYLNPDA